MYNFTDKHELLLSLSLLSIVGLSLTISIQLALAHPNDIAERATLSPVSVISTRNLTGDLKLNMEELINKTVDKFGGNGSCRTRNCHLYSWF